MRCKNELITCRNVATRNSYCDQHQVVVYPDTQKEDQLVVDVVLMTPQQKAAKTRAAKKAKLEKDLEELEDD